MPEQFLSVWKPKYGMLGEALKSAGEGLQAADEWAHKDPLGGSSTPPLGVLSDFVGVGGLGRVLEGAAYGQNKLTTGSGFTLKPTDDALDAVSAGLGLAGAAAKGSKTALEGGKQFILNTPAAFAQPIRMGSRPAMFAGQKSQTADIGKLSSAQMSQGSSTKNNATRQTTGWMRDPADNRWKYEIDDSGSKSFLQGSYLEKTKEARNLATMTEDAQVLRRIATDMRGPHAPITSEDIAIFRDEFRREPHPNAKDIAHNQASVLQKQADKSRAELAQDHEFKLEDVFHHPKLYEAYPEVKDHKVIITDKLPAEIHGDYKDGVVRINRLIANDPNIVRSVILHEEDHALQRIEGFGRGGSSSGIKKIDATAAKDLHDKADVLATAGKMKAILSRTPNVPREQVLSDALTQLGLKVSATDFPIFKQNLDNLLASNIHPTKLFRDSIDIGKKASAHVPLTDDEAFAHYQALPGEAMARNTQARMDMTVEQRKASDPLAYGGPNDTLDVDPSRIKDYKPKYRLRSAP